MFRFAYLCMPKRLIPTNCRWKHSKKDYYKVLQLKEDCTTRDIRMAFNNLTKMHHPDKHAHDGKEENSEKFTEIVEAYRELMKERTPKQEFKVYRKEEYDEWLAKQADRDIVPPKIENSRWKGLITYYNLPLITAALILYVITCIRKSNEKHEAYNTFKEALKELQEEEGVQTIDAGVLQMKLNERMAIKAGLASK